MEQVRVTVETSATEKRLMTQEDFTRFSLDRGQAMANIREIWDAMLQDQHVDEALLALMASDNMAADVAMDELGMVTRFAQAGMTTVGDTQGSAGPVLQPLAPPTPLLPAAPTDDTEGFDGEVEDSWGGGDAMDGSAELDPMQDGPGAMAADPFKANLTESLKEISAERRRALVVIPGGVTAIVQTCDVSAHAQYSKMYDAYKAKETADATAVWWFN